MTVSLGTYPAVMALDRGSRYLVLKEFGPKKHDRHGLPARIPE